ncbi:hypothetical protein DOY81_002651, partial [Sarcophaga bullata]
TPLTIETAKRNKKTLSISFTTRTSEGDTIVNANKIKETGIILRRIKLDHVDVRFRQSVEKFFYEILVINFKVQLLGLIEINLGLLHDVLSAVTSFLLILIQSDLTLRFSLK